MTAAWLLARMPWRARWLPLAMIAALAGSVTIAAVAAARRADSAFDRFVERTHAAKMFIKVDRAPDTGDLHRIADWTAWTGLADHDDAGGSRPGRTTPRVRTAMRWHAMTTATVGLAVGLPVGLAVAGVAWSTVTTSLGVVDDRVVPELMLVIIAVLTMAAAVLLALPPGLTAARTPVAEALRSE